MPCAITSSSSTIRTFGIGASLATWTAAATIARVKTTRERELKLDVDPGFDAARRSAARPIGAAHVHLDLLRHAGAGGCSTAGSRFAGASRSRSGVWQLKLPSDGRPLRARRARGPERRRAPSSTSLLAAAPRRRRRSSRSRSSARAGRASPSARGAGPDRGRLDTVAVARRRRDRRLGSPRSRPRSVKGDGRPARRDRQGAAQGRRAAERRRAQARAGPRRDDPRPSRRRTASPIGRLRSLLVEQYDDDARERSGRPARRGPRGAAPAARRDAALARAAARGARRSSTPDWAEPLRPSWRGSAALLGPVRDLDVLLEHLDAEAGALEGDDARAFRRLRARLAAERNQRPGCAARSDGGARATSSSSTGSRSRPHAPGRRRRAARWPRSPPVSSRACARR